VRLRESISFGADDERNNDDSDVNCVDEVGAGLMLNESTPFMAKRVRNPFNGRQDNFIVKNDDWKNVCRL